MQAFARVLLASVFLVVSASAQSTAPQRHFTFHYGFTVRNVTAGQPLRVWLPLAHSDLFQDVKVISENGDLPLRHTREQEYGDEMLYAETPKATKPEYAFEVVYDVVRRESSAHRAGVLRAAQQQRLLSPDKLVPTTGLPADLAATQVASIT